MLVPATGVHVHLQQYPGWRTKHHQSAAPEDNKENQGDKESVSQAGHYFLLACGPWLQCGEKSFQLVFDNNYAEKNRLENGHSKI
jgi:hypothetical protein